MRRTQLIVSGIARALAQGRGSGIRGSSGGATAAAETAVAAARASPHAFNAPFAAVARAATAVDNRFVLSKRSHWAASSLWCRTVASSAGGNSESGSGNGSDAPAYHPRDRNMAIVFTCNACDTRAAKAFSRHSYEKGLVIIRCPGCQSMHLIADHLGWFERGGGGSGGGGGWTVERALAERGETVRRFSGGEGGGGGSGEAAAAAAALTAADVAGWSRVQALIDATQGGGGNGGGGGGNDSSSGGGQKSQAALENSAAAAAGTAEAGANSGGSAGGGEGVLAVAPEDLEAWERVAAAGGGGGGGEKDR